MRVFISHTDGLENASFTYAKNDLIAEIDESRSIAIMLGPVTADIQELQDFAGSRGAFVYAYDLDGISAALDGWVNSLSSIVEFVIEADSFNPAVPGEVYIALGALSVSEPAPYELDCIP